MVRAVAKLFYKEIRGLHQAAYVLAFFALGSQVLALVRDRLLASTFGASAELDIYYTAFRIPDILFVVFASFLSVYVLIPFVTRAQNDASERSGSQILSHIFSFFLLTYVCAAFVLSITAPMYTKALFPTFSADELQQLVLLLQILLLQPLLLGLSSLVGVITQLQQRFVVYAVSPILYNIGIIIGILVLYPYIGLPGLAFGVVIGACAHLAVQIPLLLHSPLRFKLVLPKRSIIQGILAVAIPRALTLSLNQLVLLMLTIIATGMAVGSVSVFQFGFNLQSVPLTIIGVSYSVAAFPVLAQLLARSELKAFREHIQTAFRHIIFWSLPTIALIVLLRAHIVRIILGAGAFSWDDTRLTAAVLALFIASLLPQAINLLTIRAFYANGNTRTPLIVASIGSLASLGTAILAYRYIYTIPEVQLYIDTVFRLQGVPGSEVITLALGFSVGVTIQACVMLACLHRTFPGILHGLGTRLYISLLVAISGGIATWLTLQFIVKGINQETFIGILLQGGVAGMVGIITMYLLHLYFGSKELVEIHAALHRRLRSLPIIGPHKGLL